MATGGGRIRLASRDHSDTIDLRIAGGELVDEDGRPVELEWLLHLEGCELPTVARSAGSSMMALAGGWGE